MGKTLAFQVFNQGREYRIYAEGSIEGFEEEIKGPPELKDYPNPCIVNYIPLLLAQERARLILSSKRGSTITASNPIGEGGSDNSQGAPKISDINRQSMSTTSGLGESQ
jgi:hypothetical protein